MRAARGPRDEGPKVTLAFSVGEDDGVGPGDLVGAIAGESGIDSGNIGAIRINPTFSTVDIAEAHVDTVVSALRGKKIRGTPVDIKVMPGGESSERPRPRAGGRPAFKAGGKAGFKPAGKPGGFKPGGFKSGGFKPAGFKPGFKAKPKTGFSSDFKPRKRER